jgi:hypothetical protein
MRRGIGISTGTLVAMVIAVWGVAFSRAPAADSRAAGMRVVSSDATARFVALGVNKSVVIDFPTDLKELLVADPKIVNAVMRTKRRVYIIGVDVGRTNVYFFDGDGGQIGGLDISVSKDEQLAPPPLENSGITGNTVTVHRGVTRDFYNCTKDTCTEPPEKKQESSMTTIITGNSNVSLGGSTGTSTYTGTTTFRGP